MRCYNLVRYKVIKLPGKGETKIMKKKSIKVITVLLAMVMLFVSTSSVSAMSLQNTIAHRALKQQIIADKRQYCNFGMTTIKYVYADIDGDHVADGGLLRGAYGRTGNAVMQRKRHRILHKERFFRHRI